MICHLLRFLIDAILIYSQWIYMQINANQYQESIDFILAPTVGTVNKLIH